jgi:exopolyphosphatase / guanosine-5'-triphosphate,3'-diphosphate pyrophosphatase
MKTIATRASIDIGSNSVLLLVAKVGPQRFEVIENLSEITSLGKDLDKNKEFHQESMELTKDALKGFVDRCKELNVAASEIIVTATEASRVAKNAKSFFKDIQESLGLKINIITSDAEAYFSTKGILFEGEFNSETITIMDVGGASTELIRVNTKSLEIIESVSLPIGSVRSSNWLEDSLFVQNLQKVFLDNRLLLDKYQSKELYCVAGTVTSLAAMFLGLKEYDDKLVHNISLKTEDVDGLFKKYSETSPETLQEQFPFLKKRSKTMRGGLHLMYHILHRLLVKEIKVSTYGLRYGTLIEGAIKKEFLYE